MDISKEIAYFNKCASPGGKTRAVNSFLQVEIKPVYLRTSLAKEEEGLILCLLSPVKWTLLTNKRLIRFANDRLDSVEWSEIIGTTSDEPGVIRITTDSVVQFKLKSGAIFKIDCEKGTNSSALQKMATSIYGEILRNEKDPDANAAGKRSMHNKIELQKSESCGCSFCGSIFTFNHINEWIDPEKDTALCPNCGIDSVIGSASGYPVTPEFLRRVRNLGV